MRIGIIGRADNTGLGIETMEFCRNFPDAKVLIVDFYDQAGRTDPERKELYRTHLNRFKNKTISPGVPTDECVASFLRGLDAVFTIETPYNSKTYAMAREQGVKSVLRVNYEWLDASQDPPDHYVAPSLWHWDDIPDPKTYLPFPISTDRLPGRVHERATHFIHVAGNGKAGQDRNGTQALIQAIPLIQSQDIKITIKSQVKLPAIRDPRVRMEVKDRANYWDVWQGPGDVFIMPRRYAGQSLPLNEAMAKGMAIIASDMKPQNEFLPRIGLIPIKSTGKLMIKQPIEIAEIEPEAIARTIDKLAGQDISELSRHSLHVADEWSWEKMKPKYLNLFETI